MINDFFTETQRVEDTKELESHYYNLRYLKNKNLLLSQRDKRKQGLFSSKNIII